MSLTAGQLLQSRYLIERQIAQGGFAAVYRAFDQVLNRPCALKENLDTSPPAVEQFAQEALILARLHHPNLPRVVDHFLLPGQGQYLVMDYIEGQNLAQIIQSADQPMPLPQALAIIDQVCSALEYLHSQEPPVIHRDVKPQNVIITPTGKVVLVDFGIAKLYRADLPTRTIARAFTPGYAAPEQYGSAPTDVRSDIYAVGATLYALLTGRQPPDALDRLANQAPVPSVRMANPTVKAPLEKLVFKALDLTTAKRFQSVAALHQQLVQQTVASRRRGVRLLPLTLPVLLCLLLGLTVWWLLRGDPLRPIPVLVPTAVLPRPTFTPTVRPTITPLPSTVLLALPAPVTPNAIVATATLVAPPATVEPSPAPPIFAPAANPLPTPTVPITQSLELPATCGFVAAASSNGAPTIYRLDTRSGQRTKLVDGLDPAWSPDGQTLGYVVANQGIWLANADGSKARPLTSQSDWQPAWSPDGREVAFMSLRAGRRQLYKITADGQNLLQLTNHAREDRHPAWSPDGQTIAFISDRSGQWQIWLMNAAGTEQRPLTHDNFAYYKPTWSPDGQELAYGVWTGSRNEIWVQNLVSGQVRQLVTAAVYKLEGSGYGLAWSANGWIAYVADQGGNAQIAAIRADSSAMVNVTAGSDFAYFPVWLPGE